MSEGTVRSIQIGPDGTVRMVYTDDVKTFIKEMGWSIEDVSRASDVEPTIDFAIENGESTKVAKWVVRAHHDTRLAARKVGDKVLPALEGELAFFDKREDAIKWELEYFFELLPSKESK